jgi:anti-sigma regulatory factor (Ser/Thr protein kinase)
MESLSRDYASDLLQLGDMRDFVRAVLHRAWGADPADADAVGLLILALDEAATNIVLHAYERRGGERIRLQVEADADTARVSLFHRGRDFNPAAAPPPSFDGSRESGFGLHLIRQSVDEVEYARDEQGGCVIRLVKRRRPAPKEVVT